MKKTFGDILAQEVSGRYAAPVASLTELKAIPAVGRVHGQMVINLADGSRWRFHESSVLTGDDLLVVAPTSGSGRWLRLPGAALLAPAIAFGTLDAAILLTVPTGALLRIKGFAWRVTADFTGGASSAIGVSSSNKTGYTTKGDLLGGATGDVAATLVASSGKSAMGTIGAQYGTIALQRPFWKPTETLRFDRITSAFTAGSGNVLVDCDVLENDGA